MAAPQAGKGSMAPSSSGSAPSSSGTTAGATSAGRGSSTAGADSPRAVGTDLDSAIAFSPVYSAYDGVHVFKVPVTVRGYAGIQWETDRNDLVDLEQVDESTVMITTRGAGTARIIARAGSLSGSTLLTITATTPDAWALGEELYRTPVLAEPMIPGSLQLPEKLSCAGCHGNDASALTVIYTPQQTGGYSDETLAAIVTMGIKPMPGWRSVVPQPILMQVHALTKVTDENVRGLLTYLRSIEPISTGLGRLRRPVVRASR